MICAMKLVEMMYMTKEITISTLTPGIYHLDYFSRRVTDDDQPSVFGGMYLVGLDDPPFMPLTGGGSASPIWAFGGPGRGIYMSRGETVVKLTLGGLSGRGAGTLLGVGDCIAFDDVRFGFNPVAP